MTAVSSDGGVSQVQLNAGILARRQHDYRRAATHFAQALCVCLIRLPYTSALYVCLMCLPQPTRRRRWRWTRATATRPIGSASRRCFLGVSYPPSVSAFCVCLLCLPSVSVIYDICTYVRVLGATLTRPNGSASRRCFLCALCVCLMMMMFITIFAGD